jgi:hypothetical protein
MPVSGRRHNPVDNPVVRPDRTAEVTLQERLRRVPCDTLLIEAAARIDALEALLRELLEWQDWVEWTEGGGGLVRDMNRARAALKKGKTE